MENKKEIIQKIKSFFSEEVVEETKFIEVKTKDEVVLFIEGDELVEGASVSVVGEDENVPAPDGSHELEDGTVIVTEESVIVSIEAPSEEEVEEEVAEEEVEMSEESTEEVEMSEESTEEVELAEEESEEVEEEEELEEEVDRVAELEAVIIALTEKVSELESKIVGMGADFSKFSKMPAEEEVKLSKTEMAKKNKNEGLSILEKYANIRNK
jgi:hypothetical protein